jgi:hypothetical protein
MCPFSWAVFPFLEMIIAKPFTYRYTAMREGCMTDELNAFDRPTN